MNSDIWIDIKPKADLVLMYTLANVLIEKGYIDKITLKIIQKAMKSLKNM